MKVYTEEQVRKAYNEGCWNGFNEVAGKEDEVINSLTTIELPLWEIIEAKALNYSQWNEIRKHFFNGALWMKESIIKNNR